MLYRFHDPAAVQLKTKAGLALVVLGVAIFAGWQWWLRTRRFTPLKISLPSVSDQALSADFRLNFDGLYLIEIGAEKTLPPTTLDCLLGLQADAIYCKELPGPIAAKWTLFSNGQRVGRGSSDQPHCVPPVSEHAVCAIGEFMGKSGQTYNLSAQFSNVPGLLSARPQLRIEVASIALTDLQSAGVLVFSIAFTCMLFGVVLLGIACTNRTRHAWRDAGHHAA